MLIDDLRNEIVVDVLNKLTTIGLEQMIRLNTVNVADDVRLSDSEVNLLKGFVPALARHVAEVEYDIEWRPL